jgi:hypothetical protein
MNLGLTQVNWLDDDQLSVSFRWNGMGGYGYEGVYVHNGSDNLLVDVKLTEH